MKLTKIPYDKLEECKNCHVKSCDTCDAYEKEKKSFYSTTKAKGMDTLLKCQGKESIFFHLGKQKGKNVNTAIQAHAVHGEELRCDACHVSTGVP